MKRRGFTLIELLVVISIIALLSSVVLASLSISRKKARDAKRVENVKQIMVSLEYYLDKTGRYPDNQENDFVGFDTSSCDTNGNGKFFIEDLDTSGIMKPVPRDPLDITPKCGVASGFGYYRYSAGTWSCDPARGEYYIITIFDLETEGTYSFKSPGFNCPSRSWGWDLDWVAGHFMN